MAKKTNEFKKTWKRKHMWWQSFLVMQEEEFNNIIVFHSIGMILKGSKKKH
jgi:hypothetical protein